MSKENNRNRIIAAVAILVVVIIIVGIVAYVRHLNEVRDANLKVQPTFTGPPDINSAQKQSLPNQ